jgi:hypothetical protein
MSKRFIPAFLENQVQRPQGNHKMIVRSEQVASILPRRELHIEFGDEVSG